MNTTTLKDTVMSDTNWQCKEGDPFKADITYRLRNNYAQELCFNAMREPTIYAEAADHIEAQQQRIEALERELAEARKDAARYRMPPLNNDLREILGFMCFQCISIAKLLRASGYEIKTKAEDEQATVIHFFLSMYAEHGAGWKGGAKVALKAMGEAIDAASMKEQA